jgi:hypothetical protein
MKRLLTAHVAAATLVLIMGTSARAGLVAASKVQWSYNFTPAASAVYADTNSSAGVSFTNEPTKSAVGDSDVVMTNMRVFSTADPNKPDALTHNGSYKISLTLGTSANGSPMSGTLTFMGKLTGTFSAASANVSNMFGSNTTQTLTLGNYLFTVSLTAYTPAGPPDQVNAGSISAHVAISGIHVATGSPEPSSMLLAGLGLSFMGGAAWRKRRLARMVM